MGLDKNIKEEGSSDLILWNIMIVMEIVHSTEGEFKRKNL